MHCAFDSPSLLVLWESCLAHTGIARGDALLRCMGDTETAARPLGERNAALAELHARIFGPALALRSACPVCDTSAEFEADCAVLLGAHRHGLEPQHRVEAEGCSITFRLCRSADVAGAAAFGGGDVFARELLLRCVVACERDGQPFDPRELPDVCLDAVSRRMEALDPLASVSFALSCPACGVTWDARLDLGQCVWQKVQLAAERLLLDIDALARAYGWTERDVLALSPTRRAAYVQMVAS